MSRNDINRSITRTASTALPTAHKLSEGGALPRPPLKSVRRWLDDLKARAERATPPSRTR